MPERILLALDSGSQSSRALLLDSRGSLLGSGQRLHKPMLHPAPGAVEQDPFDIRDCLWGAIRDCLKEWGGDPSRLAAAALTSQRSTVLPLDGDAQPLGNAISWLDRREARLTGLSPLPLRLAVRLLGPKALLTRLLARSWAQQLAEREPAMLKRMRWLVPIEAWLLWQLVGRMALAPGCIVGPWPFDPKARGWSDSRLMYKALGFQQRWLPEVVEVGQEMGRLLPEAASGTGLPRDLPFFACGGDKQAEGLGGGVLASQPGLAAVSLGTGSSVALPWHRPLGSARYHWLTLAAVDPHAWWLEVLVFRGLWTARWFAEQLGRDLQPSAEQRRLPVEALLAEEAAGAPPGCQGLMTWPRWSPTLQRPEETGMWLGLKEIHQRAHLFRSLMEGIAYDLRRGLETLERATGTRVERIHVGGGGARSSLMVQILADVLDRPVELPESLELAARGAAMVAATGVGMHPQLHEAARAMAPVFVTTEPVPENARLYDRLFRQAYLPGLKAGAALSARIGGQLPVPDM